MNDAVYHLGDTVMCQDVCGTGTAILLQRNQSL
jgi:hypothetical protein